MRQKLKLKTKILISSLINSFTVLTFIFFSPLEIYLGNISEFTFSIQQIWWILLVTGIIVIIVLDLIEIWLPEVLYVIILTLVFALGIGFYVQIVFLNGSMSSLTTDNVKFSTSVISNNVLIWSIVFLIIIIIASIMLGSHKKKTFLYFTSFIAGSLVVMQVVGLLSLLITSDIGSYRKLSYLTDEGEFELSNNKNTIVFILDTCDDEEFTEPILARHPELFNNLKGFTYYPNATSTYSRTFPSIPYLLTKKEYFFDIPYYQYIDSAYQDSEYLEDLQKTNADIRIFTEDQYAGEGAQNYFNNTKVQNNDLAHTNVIKSIRKMFKLAAYRDLPYIFKNRFEYRTKEINNAILTYEDRAIQNNDALFGEVLNTTKLTKSNSYESAYRFYHFQGVHVGTMWNHGETYEDDPVPDLALVDDFKIIDEYIKQLQDLGLYKDATIIITADHGISEGNHTDLELHATARPIMIVKPAGKDVNDSFEVSQAPVCHNDLFPTILNSLNPTNTSYGTTISDIPQNSTRERYYYRTAYLEDNLGEVELQEYLITGNAESFDNWHYTGKKWKIKYSEHRVFN